MANQTIRTLVVEGNPEDTRLIHEMITAVSSIRFTLENVERLSTAKEILRLEPFDLVLLDLSLPDSQGLGTFIDLHPHAICLPVVVLTKLDDELLAIEAVRAGAQDYLIKRQVDGEFLVRALRYAIERKQTENTLRIRNQQLTVLTEQLLPKAKLISLTEELITSLTREINNPLAIVSAQLEELLAQFPTNDQRYATLQEVEAEVERISRLVVSLLQTSLKNASQEGMDVANLIPYLHERQADNTQNDETRFFEALGVWVTEYLLKGASGTPRLLDHYLKSMKKSRASTYESLSPREREVMYLIAKGHTNKEIAKRLSLSIRTVERHSSSVMDKLGLQNRAELIAYAVRQGIIDGNDVPQSKRGKDTD